MSYIDLENSFFGRTKTLDLLKRRVIDLKEGYRQNIAILGNQFVGKTSLLHHFIANLDERDVTVVYLDFENKDFGYFMSKLIGSLLYNYSKKNNLSLHDDINLLLETTKDHIPNTVQVIRKIQKDFGKGKVSECYLGLLTLPEVFTNETEQFCVLVLDEFQNIDNFMIPDAFINLGKKIMTQKKCLYIVSSSFPSLAQKILSEKLSLLFGNFEIVDIDAFGLATSQKFIDQNLKGIKIGVQLRGFLTDFAGGHPLYLNLLCRELINLCSIHNQGEVYKPILTQAVENTIFDRWGVISRHFEIIIKDICGGRGNSIISSILISLSNGKYKIDEIINDVIIKKAQMTQRLNRLIELGVVVKNGDFYCFKDKLLKYWIKFVYQKRLRDVELAPDKQRKQYKEEFHKLIDDFNVTSRKDLSSRIVELFNCFDNEAFSLNGRKYRLPLFRTVEPFRFKNESGIYFDMIKASSENDQWFVVVKKDNVGETDINTVLSEVKKMTKRIDRCLIISLTGLDENARIRALEERFWIWNEGEINTLLTLFDKPYIL